MKYRKATAFSHNFHADGLLVPSPEHVLQVTRCHTLGAEDKTLVVLLGVLQGHTPMHKCVVQKDILRSRGQEDGGDKTQQLVRAFVVRH